MSEKTTETKTQVDLSAIFAGDVVHLKVSGEDQYAEVLSINDDGNMTCRISSRRPNRAGASGNLRLTISGKR